MRAVDTRGTWLPAAGRWLAASAIALATCWPVAVEAKPAPPLSPCAGRPADQILASHVPPKPVSFYLFPRPRRDSRWGLHWIPTSYQPPDVVDRYVREARRMGISWVTILNDDASIGGNDYLVRRAVAHDIEPVMRVYTPNGQPIQGDLAAMVRHYRALGVRYFQLYNEPNLAAENEDGVPNVERYVDYWSTAARTVIINGGYPGIGALSPGGTYDDLDFLAATLARLQAKGDTHLLDCAWLALHNYSFNRPIDYVGDQHSYLGFRLYHQIIGRQLQRPLPMIATEGGTQIGVQFDPAFPAVSAARHTQLVMDGFRYMQRSTREPYYFSTSYWLIANEVAGATELAWSSQALFRHGDVSPIVYRLRELAAPPPRPRPRLAPPSLAPYQQRTSALGAWRALSI